MKLTTLAPAFSMRVRLGTRYRSVVRRSTFFISAAVRIFIAEIHGCTGTPGAVQYNANIFQAVA
jgi:hypothetical protein